MRERPGRYHTVQVVMVQEHLAPRMENEDEPHLAAQAVSWIAAESGQSFRDCPEEYGVQLVFIALSYCVDLVGQGKDCMEVSYRQKLSHAGIKPACLGHGLALGAMPVPAGIVNRTLKTAQVTSLNAASLIFRAAADDGGDNPPVCTGHGMHHLVLVTMGTKDICNLAAGLRKALRKVPGAGG